MKNLILAITLAALVSGCNQNQQPMEDAMSDNQQPPANTPETGEDFLWLEEIQGERALAWVAEQNADSLGKLKGDPRYEPLRAAAEQVYTSTDRIPYGEYYGGKLHNFWQDDKNTKGLVRVTTLEEYTSDEPSWDVLLDIDALAKAEDENWVYKGRNCLAPAYTRCLISLSRGGGDAVEIREFDLTTRQFIEDGFFIPEAKTQSEWLDKDHLLVATDEGAGSLTTSGYPRILRKWKRGTALTDAPILLEAEVTDTLVAASTIHRPEGDYTFLISLPAFFQETIHYLGKDDRVMKLPLPNDVDFRGVFNGRVLAMMRSDWKVSEDLVAKQGSLVSIDLEESANTDKPTDVRVVYQPEENVAINSISVGRDGILISVLEDVSGALYEFREDDSGWKSRRVDLPSNGSINVITTDPVSGITMVNFESFLTPDTLYLINQGSEPEPIKSLPARFDASDYQSEQRFAKSADGTRVPYYIVHRKDMKRDGSAPTLTDAYGGFEVARTPAYFGALGMSWIEAGGVYVLANIRGGGEYGPRWHRAALKENRQKAYDDYIAVHEDLIASNVTSADKLAIRGGSNGGLLVTAVMVQRPDLYQAVICAVPLIDMLRYHKLSAGASWMGEYGDPDIPEQREYISRYSPYQNVSADASYPNVFFWTNTLDDRVHPSHARRMVAKMRSMGHDVLYYENTEGGHGGGADPLTLSHTTALELVYLMQQLGIE